MRIGRKFWGHFYRKNDPKISAKIELKNMHFQQFCAKPRTNALGLTV